MRVIGREKLIKFIKKHANAKGAVEAWYDEVSSNRCDWKTTHDVKERYASADFLPGNRVIFNIKGNHYRLVVKVRYRNGIVTVDWIGTHAEYDKKSF